MLRNGVGINASTIPNTTSKDKSKSGHAMLRDKSSPEQIKRVNTTFVEKESTRILDKSSYLICENCDQAQGCVIASLMGQ